MTTLKSTALAGVLLLSIGACAPLPTPLCDREAQEWNKFDTQEDQCATTAPVVAPKAPIVKRPPLPRPAIEPPVSEPEVDPEDKPKSDNSDANGKGGNKHDRDDKTNGGTEEAEDKKDD